MRDLGATPMFCSVTPVTAARDPDAPRFSVVVPAFNAERTVEATLRSVLAQTCGDFEVIVVDDGSTDATALRVQGLRNDPRIRLLSQPNAGLPAAYNAGIVATRGRFVSFLDSDDLWLPSYLTSMGEALDANPAAGFAYTDAWVWHESVHRFGRQTIMASVNPPATAPESARDLFRHLVARNFIYGSATVRRSLFAEVGMYNPELRAAEDWELWLRMAARGYTAVKAAPVLAVYRVHPGSMSSDVSLMREAERRALAVVASYDLDTELALVVRTRRDALALSRASRPDAGSKRVAGRERVTRHLPSFLRLRSYRLRPPRGVPRFIAHLLLESQERS